MLHNNAKNSIGETRTDMACTHGHIPGVSIGTLMPLSFLLAVHGARSQQTEDFHSLQPEKAIWYKACTECKSTWDSLKQHELHLYM